MRGCLVHVVAAAIGLSALLAGSSTAFTVVKWVGAAYLCYVGLGMLFVAAAAMGSAARGHAADHRAPVFWQGVLTNALNPKVALFFLAFLPQFVDAGSPHKTVAFLVLGLLFDVNGTMWCFTIAALAARAGVPHAGGPAMCWSGSIARSAAVRLSRRRVWRASGAMKSKTRDRDREIESRAAIMPIRNQRRNDSGFKPRAHESAR